MKNHTARFCVALATTLLIASGCTSPAQTGSKTNTGAKPAAARQVNPKSVSAARFGAARSINLISKLGDASLKVRNNVKGKLTIANARLANPKARVKYRLFDADGQVQAQVQASGAVSSDSTVNATADASASLVVEDHGNGNQVVKDEQGNVQSDVQVTNQPTTDANNGTPGDKVETSQVVAKTDNVSGETGTQQVRSVKGADGKVKSGEIAYTPDDQAKGKGEGDEKIKFNVNDPNGNSNKLSVTLPADPADPKAGDAQADLQEQENDNGDVTTEGDLTLPGGDKAHIVVVVHANGTKEITCIAGDYSFKVSGVTPDGVGTGFLFDRDPSDPQAQKLALITLNKGDTPDTIAFLKDDGVTPDATQTVTFKFKA